jgi:hypothetical protein
MHIVPGRRLWQSTSVLVSPKRGVGQRFSGLKQLGDRSFRGGGELLLGETRDDSMTETSPGPGWRCDRKGDDHTEGES